MFGLWGDAAAPPVPTKVSTRIESAAPVHVMPPLPPPPDLAIFDDFINEEDDNVRASKRDKQTDTEEVQPAPHPDDVLKGVVLLRNQGNMNHNTTSTTSTTDDDDSATDFRTDSFYLVYSARSKLVKVGVTLYTYEECFQKFSKLYGHLDAFQFLHIENG